MKNTLFYIIIAAVVIYVIYRMRKSAKQTPGTTTKTTETPSNSGLFVPSNQSDDNPGTVDPGEPDPTGKVVIKTETGDCPYCGTPNARITRYISNGKVIKTDVMRGNKSCPGGYVKVKKASVIAIDSKFVKAKTER